MEQKEKNVIEILKETNKENPTEMPKLDSCEKYKYFDQNATKSFTVFT